MKKIMNWVQNTLVPIVDKIGQNPWLAATQDAIWACMPAMYVSSLVSLINVFKAWGLSFLPDLSVLSSFSFGIFGLFLAYTIPAQIMDKLKFKKMARQAGFAGLGLFLLLIFPTYTETGDLVLNTSTLGAAGMLNALVSGYITSIIFVFFAKHKLVKDDSVLPSFIATTFNTILPWCICLLIGSLLTFTLKFNLINAIRTLLQPVIQIGGSFGGFLILMGLCVFLYSFGISSWIVYPILAVVWAEADAHNAALIAQGLAPNLMHTYEAFQMASIGGQGCTLSLCFFLAFLSKSKKNKTIGRASLIPSLFNINEPVVYGSVVFNPLLMIPFWLATVVNLLILYVGYASGFVPMPNGMFRMKAPTFVYAFFAHNSFNAVIVCLIGIVVTGLIYYPFFKAYDKKCLEEEQKELESKN